MLEPPRLFMPSRRPRWRAFAMLSAAVLMLHGLALHVTQADPLPPRPQPAAPLSVRTVAPPGEAPAAAAVEPTLEPLEVIVLPPVRRVRRVATASLLKTVAAVEPAASAASERSTDEPRADAAPASGAAPPEESIPVYRTALPPPMLLRYELRRGSITGTGELLWKPSGKSYELRLDGRVAGLALLTQVSQGHLDAHGLAPLRFTDQRIRRQVQAANFQRDKGVISFSGPSNEYALVPGVQDRVSWMLQLGAIVTADPRRARNGQKVVLYVIGSRGEADVWTFTCTGVEPQPSRDGEVRTVKFAREPRKPHDTQIEVWLDPSHHYLPLRAKQTNGSDGDVFELTLRGIETPP